MVSRCCVVLYINTRRCALQEVEEWVAVEYVPALCNSQSQNIFNKVSHEKLHNYTTPEGTAFFVYEVENSHRDQYELSFVYKIQVLGFP